MKFKLLLFFVFFINALFAQNILQPGFDKNEYVMLLSVTGLKSTHSDSVKINTLKKGFKLKYKSQEVGLKNQWTYYENEDKKIGIISIRGTVASDTSWAANYYFAMIPAKGVLQFSNRKFQYQLAKDSSAAVHAGWTIALSYFAENVVEKIKIAYLRGIKNFYIFGHSQGAAISYLLRSYLYYEQQNGKIANDIQFKTYSSAPPKPGNTQYAYDYEFINKNGWAFSVINAKDWVTETPFTVQTMNDMNALNPLLHMKDDFSNVSFFKRMVLNTIYNKVKRSPEKTRDNYIKNFGHRFFNLSISKMLPELIEPQYALTINYVRTGFPILLMPDADYLHIFNEQDTSKKKNYFLHHSYEAYYYLLKKIYLTNEAIGQ